MPHFTEAKQPSEKMSHSKHSPGPWKFSGRKKTSDKPSGLWDKNIHDTAGFQIAMAVEQDSQFETEANARLIAAAPELLAACEGILANFHESVRTSESLAEFPALKAVADAIAKATGQQLKSAA